MFDYIQGKADWMDFNLPVEGERGPYIGQRLVEVVTCRPDDDADAVAGRLPPGGRMVVTVGDRTAVGEIDAGRLRGARPGQRVCEIMEVVPRTLRPSVLLADVDERAAGRLVTTSDGRLLGALDPEAVGSGSDVPVAELRRQLIDHGHTAEEADRILADSGG